MLKCCSLQRKVHKIISDVTEKSRRDFETPAGHRTKRPGPKGTPVVKYTPGSVLFLAPNGDHEEPRSTYNTEARVKPDEFGLVWFYRKHAIKQRQLDQRKLGHQLVLRTKFKARNGSFVTKDKMTFRHCVMAVGITLNAGDIGAGINVARWASGAGLHSHRSQVNSASTIVKTTSGGTVAIEAANAAVEVELADTAVGAETGGVEEAEWIDDAEMLLTPEKGAQDNQRRHGKKQTRF